MLDTLTNEEAVVGAIALDPDFSLPLATALLTPNDFLHAAPKAVFQAALTLSTQGKQIDPVTMLAEVQSKGERIEQSYMVHLMEITPTTANVEEYAKLVKEDSKRRQLVSIAEDIQGAISEHEAPDDVAGRVYTALDELDGKGNNNLITTQDALMSFMDYRNDVDTSGARVIIQSGYSDYDRMLGGGLMKGGVYIIAGRPGMGKTSAGICILDNMAAAGFPSLFISLEMKKTEVTAKRLARYSNVAYKKIMFSKLSPEEYQAVNRASQKLYNHNVTLVEAPYMTTTDIMLAARRVKGLKCLCIDHFSLIVPQNKRADRVVQYTEISNEVKRMAKTLDVPVLLLMQLNRANEQRGNKRPMLSDLRETGAAEQDADAVTFLHRESYYDSDAKPQNDWSPDDLEMIVAKNRHGSTGTVKMYFFGATGSINAQYEN